MFKWTHWSKIRLRANEIRPVPIVRDGGIASVGVREGKFTPLVIVDTTGRPDIDELVRIHQHILTGGDAIIQWGVPHGEKNKFTLRMKFIRPTEIYILLEFDVERQSGLIDQIMSSGGLYVQPGRPGETLLTSQDKPKILVQIPDTGVRSKWEQLMRKSLTDGFKRRGLNKREAEHASQLLIEEWRKLGSLIRMPS